MMNRKALYIGLGFVLIFALAMISPAARADEEDQASQFTFNQPVELPGNVVLGAGTYWFAVAEDGISPGDTVQIFNADRTRIVATIKAIVAIRSETSGHSELTFAEQRRNQPIALMSWFYPDRLTGHEFVYSPRENSKLAKSEQITVMGQDEE